MAYRSTNVKLIFPLLESHGYIAQSEHCETRPKLSYSGVISISFKSHPPIPGSVGLFAKLAYFHYGYKVVYLHYRGSY